MKSFVKNLVLSIASLAIGLMIAEMVLSIAFPIESSLFLPDDRLLFRLAPNWQGLTIRRAEDGGERFLVKTNRSGFRGDVFSIQPKGGRIIVYGDSFVFAKFSALDNTFSKKLEKNIRDECDCEIEVLNAGVIGYGPDQISLKMERELEVLEPDIVIIAIFANNDFGDLLRNKIFSLGPSDEPKLNSYFLNSLVQSRMQEFAHPKGLRRLQLYRRTSVFTSNLARRPPDGRWLGPLHNQDLIRFDLLKNQSEFDSYRSNYEVSKLFDDTFDADIALFPNAPSSQYKIRLMEQVLKRMWRTAQSREVPAVLLIIPHLVDLVESFPGHDFMAEHEGYDPSRLTDVLVEIAERNGIDYVNLFGPFKNAQPERLYLSDWSHWSDAGQDLAAKLVKHLLLSRGLLE